MSGLSTAPAAVGVTAVYINQAPGILTDFTDRTLWIPFGHPRGDLTITTAGLRVKTNGAGRVATPLSLGVTSRFKLFPDSVGALAFRVKVTAFVPTVLNAASDFAGVGISLPVGAGSLDCFLLGNIGGSALPFIGSLFITAPQSDGGSLSGSNSVASGTTIAEFRFVSDPFDVTLTPQRYSLGPPEYRVGGSGSYNFSSSSRKSVGHGLHRGIQISLGLWGNSILPPLEGTITEFELISGLAVA